jgi:formylglycine-generating enzyme required for sulfatase activity
LSNLPSKYRLFLQTCFNWNPKDRYDSAEEMLSSFKRMLFEKESEASPHPIIDSTPEEKKLPQKVKEFTNSLGMDFVWIEPGAFMMGSPESETERNTNETQHKVILTKGFYLQTTVVTQGQWQAIMGTNIRQQRDTVDPSLELPGEDDLGINNYCSEGDNYPIYYVSWDEAQDFIRRLNRRTNKNYRLPTEAEWEYACRAGSTSRYCFGDSEELLQKYAWYEGNSDERVYKVALKQPNEWGLYDMHGNVDEWCNDYWSGDHPSDYVVDPTGPSGGSGHVLRGGSWRDSGRKCRSARRNRYVPHYRFDHLGFRLATSEPDVSEQKPETSSQIEIESTLKEKESPQLENKFTNSYGMDFVWIEPGTFMMGSPENELGRSENEAQHQVTLTNGFYMQTTVVTQGQWAAVMKNNPVINQGQWSAVLRNRLGAGRAQIGDDYPVVYVRWQDVQKFIRILNIKSFIHNFFSRKRYIYRLPTEAEWEYACRAGSTSRFYFGENEGELDEYVWYNGNRRSIYPHRVAQKKPNAWGLYDMQGNVDEWCCDWYEEYSSDSVVNPLGPICSLNDQRVIRGGSCFSHTHHCRSASRSRTRIFVNEETYTLGFRLVFSKWTRSKPT